MQSAEWATAYMRRFLPFVGPRLNREIRPFAVAGGRRPDGKECGVADRCSSTSVAGRPPAGTAQVGMMRLSQVTPAKAARFSVEASPIAGFDLPLLVARRIAVAQVVQRRDPGLEAAESPANVGSN
jgi:hypothetical protein